MSKIDDRIVSMKFDNASFENKLGDTLKSLDKLKQSLDFANSTRGLNELSTAGKNFNMDGMGGAIEGVSAKFLALTTIGVTALATLVSKAIESGARIIKAFSLAPVMDGFREYETNINSIQTILANTDSKGTTLKNVNDALDQLNTYADQTIYNFSQMTKNIGTFTAAGIDLDKSVSAIKGIANLAAISGSNSEQASTAMYQLSQALASGTVKLMDWNSVVNAGMGGEVFQKALFESGKAMKTLNGVPMGQTFEEWKKAGNSFRGSLETGWITAEVLTNTLQGFTGDLTEAQIMSMGYTKEQAVEIQRLGKIGKAAATEVKTFTQLIGTVKEAVGSGWSSSFRLIIGDFDEAKKLFTNISNGIGGIVSRSAEARNKLLQGWRDLGGRDEVLQGFENLFASIGSVLGPVANAFRDIFPPMTAQRLFDITQGFSKFAASLRLSQEASSNIRKTFAGVFSVIEIGWTVIKGVLGLIGQLIGGLSGSANGLLGFTANLGDGLKALNKFLVEGGAIERFFDRVSAAIAVGIKFIKNFTEGIKDLFNGFSGAKAVDTVLGSVENRMDSLTSVSKRFGDAWSRLSDISEGLRRVLDGVWNHIRTWFSELGAKLAEAIKPGDFNAAVDVVNIGLLGGIALLLKKFVSNGFKLDLGGGIMDNVRDSLDALTGKLTAMQANVKADTLMKIAIAVGILTVSVAALSLIDSVALTKALVAMSVGFGQLVGVMTLLSTLTMGPMSAVKVGILTASMILLASAMVILSIAIKNLSSLGWAELAKGLIGVSVGLTSLVIAVNLISANPAGLIRAGFAMIGISAALWVLSKAVASFGDLSWGELVKGLTGVAIGLGVLVVAMSFMPSNMILTGTGLIAVATGLLILSQAVKLFSDMSWGEMAKGLVGIFVGLVLIAGAMHLMPLSLPITAAGMVILSAALIIMAGAVAAMGSMKLGTLAKGIGAIAVMLIVLAVGVNAMTGALAGAAALVVVSGALVILAHVLQQLGKLSLGEIAKGLGTIAAVMIILGISAALLTPVIPMLYSLGIALTLIGVSFALFGVGAMLVAKAFEMLAQAGKVGVNVLIDVIIMFIKALPEFVGALVQSLGEMSGEILLAGELILRLVTVFLLQLLETVIKLVPKIAETLGTIISAGIKLIREKFPEMLIAGFEMLMEFLKGIRDNIAQITLVAIEIVIALTQTLTDNIVKLVDAGIRLLTAFLNAISERIGEVVAAGLNVLVNLILGISNNLFMVIDIVERIVSNLITELANRAGRITTAGADALIAFITGIANNIIKVVNAATDVAIAFVNGMAANAIKFARAAADALIDFLNGLASAIRDKSPELRAAGVNIAGAIIDGITGGLASRAREVATSAINMARGAVNAVTGFLGIDSPSKVFMGIGRNIVSGLAYVLNRDNTAKNSAVQQAENIVKAFEKTLTQVPDALSGLGDMNPVITPVLDLTKVRLASKGLDRLMSVSSITPDVSFRQANLISTTSERDSSISDDPVYTGPSEVKFEQNIYSPTELSTNDIYRTTKSQLALAKEELGIS